MKIGYLINQYPHTTHSFIRREIRALESLGVSIARLSLRTDRSKLVTPEDIQELDKTRVITEENLTTLFVSLLHCIFKQPNLFCRTVFLTIKLGLRRRQVMRHLAYFVEASHIKKIAINEGITHIHAHFGTNTTSIAMLIYHLGGPTYSFTVHGPEEFDSPAAISLSEKIEHARFVIGVSEFGKSQLYRWTNPQNWKKVHVVHCALDLSQEGFKNHEESPIKLLCVGRLAEQKGQTVLIQSLQILRDEYKLEPKLTLIGDGPMRESIENSIEKSKLESQVTLKGWMSQDGVEEALGACSHFVLPSFAEGLPVAIMEAVRRKTPVISTYIAGIPELISDGYSGWLSHAGDPRNLAYKIHQAISSDAMTTDTITNNAWKKLVQNHDINGEAKKLLALFESVHFGKQS